MLNRKRIAIILGAFLAFVVVTSVVYVLFTGRATLTIKVKTNDTDYVLKDKKDQPVKTFSDNSSFKLRRGSYAISAKNPKYDQKPLEINLKEDLEITLDPAFSFDYRRKLEKENLAKINQVLTEKYNQNDIFTIFTGKFLQDNDREFYTTHLELKTEEVVFTKQAFKVILEKENEKDWKVVIEPNAILSRFDNPSVPIDIINQANQLAPPAGG